MFGGPDTVSQIFPTVSQSKIEPHYITTTKIHKSLLYDYLGIQMK